MTKKKPLSWTQRYGYRVRIAVTSHDARMLAEAAAGMGQATLARRLGQRAARLYSQETHARLDELLARAESLADARRSGPEATNEGGQLRG